MESVLIDATKFQVPDSPLVIHFFNPFRGPVLKAVVDEIERSYAANPRPIVIIYIDPKYREVFDERRFLALELEQPSRGYLYPKKVLVYRAR